MSDDRHKRPKPRSPHEKTVMGVAPPANRPKTILGLAPRTKGKTGQKTMIGVAVDPNRPAETKPRPPEPSEPEILDVDVESDNELVASDGGSGEDAAEFRAESPQMEARPAEDDALPLPLETRLPKRTERAFIHASAAMDDPIEPAGVPRSGVLGKLVLLVVLGAGVGGAYVQRGRLMAYAGRAKEMMASPATSPARPPDPSTLASTNVGSVQEAGAIASARSVQTTSSQKPSGASSSPNTESSTEAKRAAGRSADAGVVKDAGVAKDAGAPKKGGKTIHPRHPHG